MSPTKALVSSNENNLGFSLKRSTHNYYQEENKSPMDRILVENNMTLLEGKTQNQENREIFYQRRSFKGSTYSEVKSSLNNSVPNCLVGRDAEINEITSFINEHALSSKPGSLYMSGAPGTGKTACLVHILSESMSKINSNIKKHVTINCMTVRTAAQIYQRLATELGATSKHLKSARSAQKYIESELIMSQTMVLVVLDEVDQLDSKHQDVLYTMFGWPLMRDSKIILIGIANSLDLTDRILPRLQTNVGCKPKLINFKPYSKDQLVAILQSRLSKASHNEKDGPNVFDPMALQFCARKVAAMTGDARKALDVCRRAVEVLEISDQKISQSDGTVKVSRKVGLKEISNIMTGVYKSANICNEDEEDTDQGLPLQQKLLVCTLLLLSKKNHKEITLGLLYDSYASICKKRHVTAVNQSEFFSLSELVESRGLISVKKAKLIRQTKIKLNIQEKEVESALEGRTLLSSILQAGL